MAGPACQGSQLHHARQSGPQHVRTGLAGVVFYLVQGLGLLSNLEPCAVSGRQACKRVKVCNSGPSTSTQGGWTCKVCPSRHSLADWQLVSGKSAVMVSPVLLSSKLFDASVTGLVTLVLLKTNSSQKASSNFVGDTPHRLAGHADCIDG